MYEIIEELENFSSDLINCNLLPDENMKNLIWNYTEFRAEYVNNTLNDGYMDNDYELLSDFLSKVHLIKNVLVFRGISGKDFVENFVEDYEIGAVYQPLQFISTSLSKKVAYYFPHGINDENDVYINFHIRLPKVKGAYYIEDYTATPKEYEVLIKNDTAFKILSINKLNNEYTIEMEVNDERISKDDISRLSEDTSSDTN